MSSINSTTALMGPSLSIVKCWRSRCFSIFGFFPFLYILGGYAAAYVFPNRHVGRPAERVCRNQIFSLYPFRVSPYAGWYTWSLFYLWKDI